MNKCTPLCCFLKELTVCVSLYPKQGVIKLRWFFKPSGQEKVNKEIQGDLIL